MSTSCEQYESQLRLLLLSVPTLEVGRTIARTLLQERLVACTQLQLGSVEASYWWNDSIETTSEYILTCKTAFARTDEIEARVSALHPYQTPEIVWLKVDSTSPGYGNWLRKESANVIVPTS